MKCVVILWKNNYAALKLIDVGFFISLKYLFPFIFYLSGGKTYQPALVYTTETGYIYIYTHTHTHIFRQGRKNPKRLFALAIKFLFVAPTSGDSQRRTCFLPLSGAKNLKQPLIFLENLGNPSLR